MARNHARILTSIWNDQDFLNLNAAEQRTYLMLLSQQNLSHAGLLPLTVKRWANKAPDTTVDDIETALEGLQRTRFVFVDRDTEELLIRSLMRGDEAWKHWKVMTAAVRDAAAITSSQLRSVTAGEVARMLAIRELPDQSRKLLERLRDGLPKPIDSQSIADASPQGQGYVTVGTTADLPLPPCPAPTPAPWPAADDSDPEDDPVGQLLREHCAAYTEAPPPSAQVAFKREILRLVSEQVPPERIRAGLTRMREKRLAASLLPQLVTEAAQPAPANGSRNEQILARSRARAAAAEAGNGHTPKAIGS